MGYPKMPQVGTILPSQNATAKYKWAKNTSGGAIGSGDILILDVTAANHGLGQYLPVTTVAGDDSDLVCGVVPIGYGTVPDDGFFPMQVSGLHTAVKVNGATNIVTGDDISSSAKGAGIGKKSAALATRMGVYVDSGHTADETATDAVVLHCPFKIDPD
jgi:hypothetical protein